MRNDLSVTGLVLFRYDILLKIDSTVFNFSILSKSFYSLHIFGEEQQSCPHVSWVVLPESHSGG